MSAGLTFDAGALIALDRNDRRTWSRLRGLVERGTPPTVPAVVVAQAWRSARQANLGRALDLCRSEEADVPLAKLAGRLCGLSGHHDAVDALVVASAARRRDDVLTSDPEDISRLAAHVDGVRARPV